MDDLVSVIIPVYNSEHSLAETIRSAINQTWPYKEIIIVDDGSTDGSLAVAQTFFSEGVKIFSQKNGGASSARNRGLQESRGNFIQFLDADDLLMQNKIESQVKQLSNNPDKLSICPVIHFNKFNTSISSLSPTNRESALYKDSNDPFDFLINLYDIKNNQAAIIPVHSWLTPRKLLNSFIKWNEDLTVNDDGEFFCRVVLASAGIVATCDTFCYYRKYVNGDRISLSARKDLKSLESHYHSFKLIHEHLVKIKVDKRIDTVMADNLMALLVQTYPKHKTLTTKIKNDVRKLGGTTYSPVLGGKSIEFIKTTFGWMAARSLQYNFHKIIGLK